ncbi:MAG: acetolactate synthase small subunit [Oscillospiraceae bacterium]
MKHTISVLVENHAGVLARVAGLFARRGFNIDSLAVGVTDDERVSRITIVADGSDYTLEQIEKQLNKLIDVIKVKTLSSDSMVSRELVLIKVSCTPKQRPEIISICEIAQGKISDISANSMTIEISDCKQRLDNFEELLKPYGIKEIVRTGTIAMQKGEQTVRV